MSTTIPRRSPRLTIADVRRFNRFYTRRIGALDPGYLHSPFSLAEVRVLYELAHWDESRQERPTATGLTRDLAIDPGYLSRVLRGFERDRIIKRTLSAADGRQHFLQLTAKGRRIFVRLESRADEEVEHLLAPLRSREQQRLLAALRTVESLLDDRSAARAVAPPSAAAPRLRAPRAGDLGWVVSRHGALYAAEYGWDQRFEALVARIVAEFVEHFEAKRERCWIAEYDGENVGCVFIVRHPEREGVAKLRLLLVEPTARGLGIGRRLVAECTRFARQAGYHTITLWTNSVLVSARRIYEAAGYRLVDEAPHRSFGPRLVGQTWELTL